MRHGKRGICGIAAVLVACLLLGLARTPGVAQSTPDTDRPNIVVILVDDAALMDFGAYGGEAATPNIDALAARGAWFTQYRTSPLCSPSRAMLLTGMDNHFAGVASIPEVLPPEQKGKPGYRMALEPNVLTLADRLRASGYRTLMTGKWHLGDKTEDMPQAHGFDRSFALAASGADNWEDKPYMAFYSEAPWFEDGRPADLPGNFYSSRFIVDKMIAYLENGDRAKPFFAYMPFQAIHIPVQAPREFTAHYKGRYDRGWHVLREARYQRAQQLGLFAKGAALAPMPATARTWDSLSKEDRALYAARMEVNAAMLEAMDFQIGRFIAYLKRAGQYDNTIFVVTSDNGPEPSRGDDKVLHTIWMAFNGYHIGPEGMGEKGSWGFIGPEWANAAASPGALYKFYATEGGIRAPLIVAGPGIAPERIDSPAMVSDLAPTLLEWVAAAPAPASAKPVTGRSLLPVLRGEAASAYGPDDIRVIEVSGNSALYKGDYKITRSMRPVGDGKWRLFDIVTDPGETTDLSKQQPQIMAQMLADFDAYAQRTGVLPMPPGYNSQEQIEANALKRYIHRYRWQIALAGLVLLALLYGLWRANRGRRNGTAA